VPDYSETESAILVNVHHCIADGSGLMVTMMAMSDFYDNTMMLELAPKYGFCTKLFLLIFAPFGILKTLGTVALFKKGKQTPVQSW